MLQCACLVVNPVMITLLPGLIAGVMSAVRPNASLDIKLFILIGCDRSFSYLLLGHLEYNLCLLFAAYVSSFVCHSRSPQVSVESSSLLQHRFRL